MQDEERQTKKEGEENSRGYQLRWQPRQVSTPSAVDPRTQSPLHPQTPQGTEQCGVTGGKTIKYECLIPAITGTP